MDWTQELTTSLFWIIKVIGVVLALFPLTLWILIRTTQWGRQFWQLASDYFSLQRSLKPIGYFFTVLFFSLVTVRIDILLSEWNKALYNALQQWNAEAFWLQMAVFGVLAGVHIANALLIYYLRQAFTVHWRTWMNGQMLDQWLDRQAYYKTLSAEQKLDNPDQRIQQDITAFISNSLHFSLGLIKSVTSIFSFTVILWGLSGPLQIGGFTLPHAMVLLVFAYVLLSTVFAVKIGKPLIQLNFNNERLNADYRYSLIRLKEYAESIAFFRGETAEKSLLRRQFDRVIGNVWQIVYRTLKFNGFNLAITQISVVFPFVIQAARFFDKQIQLGELMQTSQAFKRVQASLSFFRNIYDDFAGFRAVLQRLSGFQQAVWNENDATQGVQRTASAAGEVAFHHVTVNFPDGKPLVRQLNLALPMGTSLLIQGASGIGKTTLLRAAGGLWRYAEGSVSLPAHTLFLAQKTYLPQGRLLDTLYYPDPTPPTTDRAKIEEILHLVRLNHLLEKLDDDNDWTRILSLGEQQRIAFARVLLHRPQAIFLDEATAALDERLENDMYRLLRCELPTAVIISVGHRSTLHRHHDRILQLNTDGSWTIEHSPMA